jgi:uncharacterized GH25 family protein
MHGEFNRLSSILTLVTCLIANVAGAHDFWIEPATFRPKPGAMVPVKLYVGQDFKGDSVIYLPELFERYVTVEPDGEKKIAGVPGDDPAGRFTAGKPGVTIVAYRGTVTDVSFDTRKEFEKYLDWEGLERVRALPDYARLTGKTPIRENYSRCAKSLVAVGTIDPKAPADRVLGLTLELVAERNPYALARGQPLPVRLLYKGKPLPEALVIAFSKDEPLKKIKVRTDRDGRATLKLDRSGTWLVTSVHMFPAPKGSRAQWESLWASLTFEFPPGSD